MRATRSGLKIAAVTVLAALMAGVAWGETIALLVHTWTDNPAGVEHMEAGDLLYYQIGVEVIDDDSNRGLATIMYDVVGYGATTLGYQLTPLTPADSGWSNFPGGFWALRDVTDPLWINGGFDTCEHGYNGGWGFDNAGLPTGGDVTTSPGSVLGAGMLAPLTWTADEDPTCPGLQPYVRQGVGQGLYIFPDLDPAAGGLQGGFGQDLSNTENIIEGDGTWLMQEGVIDTSGWLPLTYHFDLIPACGAVYSPTVDYNYDQGGGFRITVDPQDMAGASFSFRLLGWVGDFDGDADVDLNDFATFAVCYTNGATAPPPECAPADFEACDLDGDGDVDLNDFATFALAFTG